MENNLTLLENEIAQAVFKKIENNPDIDSHDIDQLIFGRLKKLNYFTEDWQLEYSKDRTLKEILKLAYGEKADQYYHFEKKINKNKFLLYPLIGWLPALLLFGSSESEGLIGKLNSEEKNKREGECPYCHSELIFEQKDIRLDSILCPVCSKNFLLKQTRLIPIGIKKIKRSLAITSFIFSIIGGYPTFFIFSIAAVILGHVSLQKIKKDPNTYGGSGYAIAGLILGYLGLIFAIVIMSIGTVLTNEIGNLN